MSYILDALRKADAERVRDAVPDLNAQPLAASAAALDLPEASRVPWGWLLAGGGLTLVAVLAWNLIGADSPAPAVVSAPAPAALPMPAPLPPAAAPVSANVPAPTPSTRPIPQARPAPSASTAAAPAKPSIAADNAAKPARVPKLAELPEAVKRSLPPLAVGGAVQSTVPSARMLIVDGQVLREGDSAANGLVLEQIRPTGAIFNQRGQRFELPLP